MTNLKSTNKSNADINRYVTHYSSIFTSHNAVKERESQLKLINKQKPRNGLNILKESLVYSMKYKEIGEFGLVQKSANE